MKKLYCIIISIIGILVFHPFTFSSYAEVNTDYMHFQQGDKRWGSKLINTGSSTFAQSGCYITSTAVIAAYADESLRDPTKYNPYIANYQDNTKNGSVNTNGNALMYSTFNIKPFKCMEADKSYNADTVKEALKNGHYVILNNGRHFSPIVAWDEEKNVPIVMDVWSATNTWGTDFNESCTWNDIQVADGYNKFSFDMPTKFNGGVGTESSTGNKSDNSSANSSKEQTKEEIESMNNTTNEWNLKGMPSANELMQKGSTPEFSDRSVLTTNETKAIEDIKESTNENTVSSYIRIGFSILGIFLCIYSILLSGGMLFDKVNSILDFSLVSILSFGKLKLIKDPKEKIDTSARHSGLVTYKGLSIRLGILFLVGCLFISGVVVKYVVRLVMWVIN